MTRKITKRQAEAVLAAVKAQFKSYLEPTTYPATEADEHGPAQPEVTYPALYPQPTLHMDWEGLWTASEPHPAIVWEEGPSDWVYVVSDGGSTEEEAILAGQAAVEFGTTLKASRRAPAKLPKGVWVEPENGFILAIYLEG